MTKWIRYHDLWIGIPEGVTIKLIRNRPEKKNWKKEIKYWALSIGLLCIIALYVIIKG